MLSSDSYTKGALTTFVTQKSYEGFLTSASVLIVATPLASVVPIILNSSVNSDNIPDSFDLADAMLWGMVGGAFYDSATDKKQQLNRVKSKNKTKK